MAISEANFNSETQPERETRRNKRNQIIVNDVSSSPPSRWMLSYIASVWLDADSIRLNNHQSGRWTVPDTEQQEEEMRHGHGREDRQSPQ